jgi:hypothetical protein
MRRFISVRKGELTIGFEGAVSVQISALGPISFGWFGTNPPFIVAVDAVYFIHAND